MSNRYQLITGDSQTILEMMPDNYVQCVITSPPYWGLRDYGVNGQLGLEISVKDYVNVMVNLFREIRRVLRNDGTFWLVIGDSYAHSVPPKPGSPIGKSGLSNSRENHEKRWANISATKKDWGTLKPKDLVGIPWRIAFALQDDGWYLRSDIIWAKPNPMPESAKDRPTHSHEYMFLFSSSPKYYYDADAIKETSITGDPRRPYTSQGAKDLDGREDWKSGEKRDGEDFTHRNKRTIWDVATHPYPGAHFATFPPALITPCILAGTRHGDIILDPFSGSGTTGLVALQNGRRYIGIDLNHKYNQMAARRIQIGAAQDVLDLGT